MYTATLIAANGTPPYSWIATPLPPGLALMGADIVGIPTAAGTTNVAVTVTDSTSATASKKLAIVVATAPLQVATASLPDGQVAVPYNLGVLIQSLLHARSEFVVDARMPVTVYYTPAISPPLLGRLALHESIALIERLAWMDAQGITDTQSLTWTDATFTWAEGGVRSWVSPQVFVRIAC